MTTNKLYYFNQPAKEIRMAITPPTKDKPLFSPSGMYQLDEDIDRGFETSVKNSQAVLALQYLLLIKQRLEAEVDELKTQVAELTAPKASVVETSTNKKGSTKKADAAE